MILSMLVKDELSRYLKEVLQAFHPIVRGMVFLDNGSSDKTLQHVSSLPKTLNADYMPDPFDKNETKLRKRLYDLTIASAEPGELIACFDADEMPEFRFFNEFQRWATVNLASWYAFRFYHFWGSRTHFRADGLWHPEQYGPRVFRYDPNLEVEWTSKPFACGSMPMSILKQKGLNTPYRIKHLGYANAADIPKKYELYSGKDTKDYHASSHIQSIVDPKPTLVPWRE